MKIVCNKCNRYLGESFGTVIATLKCPSCKKGNTVKVKIITEDSSPIDAHYIFEK